MRLIDADALLKALDELGKTDGEPDDADGILVYTDDVAMIIGDAPTVDPETEGAENEAPHGKQSNVL